MSARKKMSAQELNRLYRQGARDFPNVDLTGEDLTRVDLPEVNLASADLTGVDLSESLLMRANLQGARLVDAILHNSNLSEADLYAADLSGAHLHGADLTNARLWRTRMSGAIFRIVKCGGTFFGNLDLGDVAELDSIIHFAPSTVGMDTIVRSQGRLPDVFLRGCGVPEHIIKLQQTMVNGLAPIQFYSCFISYSSADEEFAKRLHGQLQQERLRVWFAPEDMKGGRKIHEQIDDAIRVHDRLLLVLSEASMRSRWVKTELKKARKREQADGSRVLFPIGLVEFGKIQEWECFDGDSGEDVAAAIREYFIPDFSNWKDHDAFEKAFGRLLSDLKKSTE